MDEINVEDRIKSAYAALRVSEQKVADYILQFPDDVVKLSIVELARAAGVSQPTVIRFSRAVGFQGYRQMRYVLAKQSAGERAGDFQLLSGFDLHPWERMEDIPLKVIRGAEDLLEATLKSISTKTYQQAVNILSKARVIDLYCVENSMATACDLLNKLTYLGLQCRMNTDAYLQQIAASHLTHQDAAVAISYSGCSADTVKALRLAKRAGAATIAVTSFSGSDITKYADVTLCAGNEKDVIYGNAIFSRIPQLAVNDMLYMGVILSSYEHYAQQLDESGLVINDRSYKG